MRYNRKYAISYIRFSTKKQALGRSYERQLREAEEFCDHENITLVKEYKDLGKSAYKSINQQPNAGFGLFIRELKNGGISNIEDTYLIVESLDRISREGVHQSLPKVMEILNLGIAIITISDKKVYDVTHSDPNQIMNDLMMSMMMLAKAHQESLDKSYRIGDAWQKKKELAAKQSKSGKIEPFSKMCPFWLKVVHKRFEIKEDYAQTIRLIFDLATGKYSAGSYPIPLENINRKNFVSPPATPLSSNDIVTFLNFNSVPILKSGKRKKTNYWNTSNVNRILSNKALLGHYQPKKLVAKEAEILDFDGNKITIKKDCYEEDGKVIENYYPQLISTEQFKLVQGYKKKRLKGRKGSKKNRFSNLLNGIAICKNCGSAMVHNDKGKSSSGKRWVYLQCSLARAGGDCEYISIKYDVLEYNLLKFLKGTDFKFIFQNKNIEQSVIDELEQKILILQQDIRAVDDEYKHWLTSSSELFKDVKKEELKKLEKKKKSLMDNIKSLEFELSELVIGSTSKDINRPEFNNLIDAISIEQSNVDEEQLYFNRIQVNELINKLVESIQICCKTKIMTLHYKNESAQFISIKSKFDQKHSIVPVINIPRIVFHEEISEGDKKLYLRWATFSGTEFLRQMIKLEDEKTFTKEDGAKLKLKFLSYIYKEFNRTLKSDGYKVNNVNDELVITK